MKVAIMQPYFLPYIGYFQLINYVDRFIIYDDVTFIKKGWINKNYIYFNKKEYGITVPLQKISQNKLIKNSFVVEQGEWIDKMFKTLFYAYGKEKAFTIVNDQLISVLEGAPNKSISKLNFELIETICSMLNIQTEIVESSEIFNNNHLKGQERIIDICLNTGATEYINPIGGMELYSPDLFKANGIKLKFIESNIKKGLTNFGYEPFISIIHNLMKFNFDFNKEALSGPNFKLIQNK